MATIEEFELQSGVSRRTMLRFGTAAAFAGLLGFSALSGASAHDGENENENENENEDET